MSKSFHEKDDEYFYVKKRKFRERRTQKLKKTKNNGKIVESETCPPTEYVIEKLTK